jgi:dipeptidyl aminopeptidase/acylaminoacyl peptidase
VLGNGAPLPSPTECIPTLMLHGREDVDVPVEQAVHFHRALQRLVRPCRPTA